MDRIRLLRCLTLKSALSLVFILILTFAFLLLTSQNAVTSREYSINKLERSTLDDEVLNKEYETCRTQRLKRLQQRRTKNNRDVISVCCDVIELFHTEYEVCRTQRLKRLQQRCYSSGYRVYRPYTELSERALRNMTQFVIADHKHRVLLLSVPKSGCSSWKSVMLMSVEDSQVPPQTINNWTMLASHGLKRLQLESSASDIRHQLNSYYFVLTVRHPFSRLESAYRSKFLTRNPMFMKLFGRDIIKRYRYNNEKSRETRNTDRKQKRDTKAYSKEKSKLKLKSKRTRDEFKSIVKRQGRKLTAAEIDDDDDEDSDVMDYSQSEEFISDDDIDWPTPTFDEFVRYVIDREMRPMNRHWDTYEEIAHPCAFIFSHVAKTETADLDMDFVSSRHLSGRHIVLRKNQHALNDSDVIVSDVTAPDMTRHEPADLPLFEQLTDKRKLAEKILKRYAVDMWLFGYTLRTDSTTGELKVGCETELGNTGMCC